VNSLTERSPVSVWNFPKLEKCPEILKPAISRRLALLIIGDCSVVYSGRASSTLDWGERLVLVKSDGSVVVHRREGYEPVNWQPPGCIFDTSIQPDGLLRIRAIRPSSRESLDIRFRGVFLIVELNLIDRGGFLLYASEEDMKRAIVACPSLIEDGFRPTMEEKRQPSGFIDVFGLDRNGNPLIVEIKKGPVRREAVFQLARYVSKMREGNPEVRGMVIAPSLGKGTMKLLETLKLEFRQLSPKTCLEALQKERRTRESALSHRFDASSD
jgi:RecB family endonuclease NucS